MTFRTIFHFCRAIDFGRNNDRVRQEWLSEIIFRIPNGLNLLDVGAVVLYNKLYCTHLKYVSQDFCQFEGKGDGEALQTGEWDVSKIEIISDITSIPVEDESFDIVVCSEVLKHVPDPLSALRMMTRIVRPKGKPILSSPFCSLNHFAPYHNTAGLLRYWYERRLGVFGFNLVEVCPNGGWFDYIAQELWRLHWIGKTYSSRILVWAALILALLAVAVMRIIKGGDLGSSELLTFGWQIIAEKSDKV